METAHRRRLESYSIKSQVGAQRRGQIFALVIALVVIGCGVVLTFAGRSTEGIVATANVVPLLGETRRLALRDHSSRAAG